MEPTLLIIDQLQFGTDGIKANRRSRTEGPECTVAPRITKTQFAFSFSPLGTGDADGSKEPPVGKDAGRFPLRAPSLSVGWCSNWRG